jgi:hypothetical protein
MVTGGAVLLTLGEIRRPLLALAAFSLPLHLDVHLGFYTLPTAPEGLGALTRITAIDLILLLLLFLWLVENVRESRVRIQFFPKVAVPAVLFITVGLVSSLFARELRLASFQFVEMTKGFLLFLYLANRVRDDQDRLWIAAGLMAAVLFQSSLGLYQAIMGRPLGLTFLGERNLVSRHLLGSRTTTRPLGTLFSTNQLALYLGMTLPIVGSLLLAPVSRWMKLAASLVILAGLATVVFTLSRATWLGLLISAGLLSLFGVRTRSFRLWQVLLGLSVLIIVVLVFNGLTGDVIIQRLTVDDHGSAESRAPLMRGALAVIADHPVLGSGWNNYRETIRIYDISGEYTARGTLPVVHNLFLLVAAETGLLGLGAFLWLLAALAIRGIRFVASNITGLAAAMTVGILAGGLHMIVHNMVHVGLTGDPQSYLTFWFLAGLLVALTYWGATPEEAKDTM